MANHDAGLPARRRSAVFSRASPWGPQIYCQGIASLDPLRQFGSALRRGFAPFLRKCSRVSVFLPRACRGKNIFDILCKRGLFISPGKIRINVCLYSGVVIYFKYKYPDGPDIHRAREQQAWRCAFMGCKILSPKRRAILEYI